MIGKRPGAAAVAAVLLLAAASPAGAQQHLHLAPAPAKTEPVPAIVVDQFGYLPDQLKVAVLREPVVGFDASQRYTPGPRIEVVATGGRVVLAGRATAWNGGAVDPSSGDRAWWFDFTALRRAGRYRIVDPARGVRSAPFSIGDGVYRPVLVQAVRMLFYQRAGFAKEAQFAGAKWADGASHQGPLQDLHAHFYGAPGNGATARDLHGGWFDAGDFNRYTPWAGHDVVALLAAYRARPAIWTDDYGIPESGDGVPDLLNEVKWELDWLIRMQNADGSLLSEIASAPGSPPSAAAGQSLYGPPTSYATTAGASAFAMAAGVYAGLPRFAAYARDLRARAERAWAWAEANPSVAFRESSGDHGKVRLAADAIETDDAGRDADRLAAATYLYDLTGDATYRDYIDAHLHDLDGSVVYATGLMLTDTAVARLTPAATAWLRAHQAEGLAGMRSAAAQDPYRAWIPAYGWGSNQTKSVVGLLFADGGDAAAAAGYVHYLHGVNPLGKVYLSNMGAFGATNSVDRFFHSWFAEGTRWESVSGSPAGPPPGYLVGGPNPDYRWEAACPGLTLRCGAAAPSPPAGQPPQKSYKDFATSWPIDSWSVTEPDLLYQTAYIRLLARFVH